MFVRKASGEKEQFNPEKILKTCIRAGASEEIADKIIKEVEKRAFDGIRTKKILQMTIELLDKYSPRIAAKYDLKGAIMRLGPAGFAFEKLVAELLREYGYKTSVHQIIQGLCVKHEIDVVAENKKRFMIECKYHNSPGIYTGIKDVLYTYARFLDLQDGSKKGVCKNFDQPWLASNTKFSSESMLYANCKNIHLIGWKNPKGKSLKDLLEKKKLYPITVLRKLDRVSQIKLSEVGLMFCRDLIKKDISELMEMTKINKKQLRVLIKEAEILLANNKI